MPFGTYASAQAESVVKNGEASDMINGTSVHSAEFQAMCIHTAIQRSCEIFVYCESDPANLIDPSNSCAWESILAKVLAPVGDRFEEVTILAMAQVGLFVFDGTMAADENEMSGGKITEVGLVQV